jgi:hypothetical protein
VELHHGLKVALQGRSGPMFGMISATRSRSSSGTFVCGLANGEPYFGEFDSKGTFTLKQIGSQKTAGDVVRHCVEFGMQLGGQ